MRNVVFAITMVIVGLVLGLFGWLIEASLSWLFSVSPLNAVAQTTIFGITLPALVGWLLIALVVVGLIAWLISAMNDRPNAEVTIDTLRETRKASEDMKLLQPIIASEDGQHAFIALHIEDGQWNASHPFYCERVMFTTPGIMETGAYYYLVVRRDGKRITPVPMPPAHQAEMRVDILMRTTGVDRVNLTFWRGLHALLAESSIPYFTSISTAICVFFISWSRKRIEGQFKSYVQQKLFPHIGRQNTPLEENPPKGLEFDAIRCSFPVGNGRHFTFTENVRQVPIDRFRTALLKLENDFCTLSPKRQAKLLLPLQDLT